MKKLVSLMLIISIIIGSISNSFATETGSFTHGCTHIEYLDIAIGYGGCLENFPSIVFPSTIEECTKDSNCIVYDGKKLKLKNNILLIPKELLDKALAKIEKTNGKIDLTKFLLELITTVAPFAIPYVISSVSAIKHFKRFAKNFENVSGVQKKIEKIKEIENQIEEKRKKGEDCSQLETKLKRKVRFIVAYNKTISLVRDNLVSKNLIALVFTFLAMYIFLPVINSPISNAVDKFVDRFFPTNIRKIRSFLYEALKKEMPISLKLCKKDRVITAQIPNKLYIDSEHCSFSK